MLKTKIGEFEALGTLIHIELPEAFFTEVFEILKEEALRIEQKFSRFIDSSDLSVLNQNLNQWSPVDEEFLFLLNQASSLTKQTHGLLDFGVTNLLNHWGYDKYYGLKASADFRKFESLTLETKPGLVRINVPVDFGCFGKGYFLDQCLNILKSFKVDQYLVNAGGDLLVSTADKYEPFKIFLEDPRLNTRVIGEIENYNGFICASSPSRRKWGDFHHLIDIESQLPAQEMSAVYVQKNISGLVADALCTALFVMGFKKAQLEWAKLNLINPDLEIMLISAEGKVWRSPHFKANLYTI
ncbi:FAD:protein FMN transferase [bacterium]|nr:FAD:protein FMN transferase [bacterium]